MAKTKEILVNGQLTQVTEFDHSAQEIDNAVEKVKGGAAALGAAPAGKGYGDVLEYLGASADETMETYCARLDAVIAKMPNSSAKQIEATPPGTYGAGRYIATIYKYFNDFAVVVGLSSPNAAQYSFGWRIVKNTNVWKPLEWQNPPMLLGVEYRTTERCEGKPVFAKRILFQNAEAISGSAEVMVPHGISNFNAMVRIFGQVGVYNLPLVNSSTSGLKLTGFKRFDETYVVLSVHNDSWSANRNWYLDMYYLKTAD